MSTASAVNAVRVGLFDALKTIPALEEDGWYHVYHEGEVTRGVAVPRVVMAGAFEQGKHYVGGGTLALSDRGHSGNIFLRCWGEDSWAAQELYESVCEKLDWQDLALDEHRLVHGYMERVTDYPEPDPEITAHVVIGRYLHATRVLP